MGWIAEPLGLLDRVAHVERVLDDHGARVTRAISATALAMSSKWCGAIRVTTRSNEASAKGRCSAGQITSGLHARRRVGAHDLDPRLAQPPGDVTPAGGDVERRLAPAAHSTIRSRSSPSRCSGALR